MTSTEALSQRMRTARTLIGMDHYATDRERAMAQLLAEAERVIAQPHLYNVDAMTAIHDVLKSQTRSTLPTGYRYWTNDRELHDRGIDALNTIYPVLTVELGGTS